MRRLISHALLIVAVLPTLSACLLAGPATTITPTVTPTPAVVVEVTHFPTTTATPTLTSAASLTPTLPPTTTVQPLPMPTQPPGSALPTGTVVVTVPAGTLIQSFSAQPTEINPGESFTLAWKVKAGQAVLWSISPTGQLSTSESVALEGSKQITTSTTARNFVTYMLYVQAGSQSESQMVTVRLRCPDTWFMANPPGDCPLTSALVSQGVYQYFQSGLMIWVQGSSMIFVLYYDSNTPRWDAFTDTWQPGMTEQDDTLTPPAGMLQPLRGFGKVWREQPGVRDRLGWATLPETSFSTAYQCNSQPKYNTCYLKGPAGVIALQPERSGWFIWTGPTPAP